VRYRAYGIVVNSDFDLGVPLADSAADIVVHERAGPVPSDHISWFDAADDVWLRAGLVHGDFYLRFGDDTEFVVDVAGSNIGWRRLSLDCEDGELQHLILDHAIPRALTRSGRIALHGSAAILDTGRSVAIIGESGWGKSTLVAGLVAAGASFLADDCVTTTAASGKAVIWPAYPGLRLAEESLSLSIASGLTTGDWVSARRRKRRVAVAEAEALGGNASLDLSCLFVLDDPARDYPNSSPARLGGSEATIASLAHAFHLNRPDERRQVLHAAAELVEAVPLHRLPYRHDEEGLAQACASITEVVKSLDS
jgi:hypothetical protein